MFPGNGAADLPFLARVHNSRKWREFSHGYPKTKYKIRQRKCCSMDAICFLKRNCKDKTPCHILKLCQETDKCFEEIKVYVKSLEIF